MLLGETSKFSILGTVEFLQSHPDFIDSEEQDIQVDCNKDTGGRKTLHCWSRGIFFYGQFRWTYRLLAALIQVYFKELARKKRNLLLMM